MTALPGALNVLLVGVWVGMYLFTTFVVSPAFTALFPDAQQRHAHRRALGRQYSRVNGPLSALLLLTVLAQALTEGLTWALTAELLLLLGMGALVAAHVHQGQRRLPPPRWLTHATLTGSALLCLAAISA